MADVLVKDTDVAVGSDSDERQLVVFRIGKEEFGINIEDVREIVRLSEITRIPRSPDYILGICNLRGNVIPALDARKRFNLEEVEHSDQTRMLVVDINGVQNGIVIDSVSEVVRIEHAEIEPAPAITKGIEREFLEGVVQLDKGARLILILNAGEVLKTEAAEEKQKKAATQEAARTKKQAQSSIDEEQLVTFTIAKEEYAFEINAVREILRVSEIVKVPEVPDYIRGILTIRNTLLPVVDFRTLIGMESMEQQHSAAISGIRDDHNSWAATLKASLSNGGKLSGAIDSGECRWGQWLESFTTTSRNVEQAIRSLKKHHDTLHDSMAAAMKLKKEDREKALNFCEREVSAVLNEFTGALNRVEGAIHENISEDQKILVIDSDGVTAGILVDAVNEVLNIERELIDDTPLLASTNKKDLKGVAKLEEGRRLIMIMDKKTVLSRKDQELISDLEKNKSRQATGTEKEATAGSEEEQFVSFSIDKEEYGLRITQVQEINRVSKITKVPRAPFFIEGVVNLRGDVIPVIDHGAEGDRRPEPYHHNRRFQQKNRSHSRPGQRGNPAFQGQHGTDTGHHRLQCQRGFRRVRRKARRRGGDDPDHRREPDTLQGGGAGVLQAEREHKRRGGLRAGNLRAGNSAESRGWPGREKNPGKAGRTGAGTAENGDSRQKGNGQRRAAAKGKRMTRVLACDDSALMRRVLRKVIETDRELSLVATARDGEDALNKARELQPDVITMDINMPNMDGMTALHLIVEEQIAPVVMVSSLTQRGAEITFEALQLGAFDFVAKPDGTVSGNLVSVAQELVRKIKAAARSSSLEKLRRRGQSIRSSAGDSGQARPARKRPRPKRLSGERFGYPAIAIGISTGGPKTIFEVLPNLPENLNAAVFLVQHMPASFTATFARRIDENCRMQCVEAKAGMQVEPGTIFLARGGHHLTLFQKSDGEALVRTPTRPQSLFVPSVDVMMESVLSLFGADTIGVLMTGMGSDGAEAMVKINDAGGVTIAESEESAIVFGMPAVAIERGAAQIVTPSWEISEHLIKAVGSSKGE